MDTWEGQLVRDYFEVHGFAARRGRLQQEPGRRAEGPDIDWRLVPIQAPTGGRAPSFRLFASELPYLGEAWVQGHAWVGRRNFSMTREGSPARLLKYLERHLKPKGKIWFQPPTDERPPGATVVRILVLPHLPTEAENIAMVEQLARGAGATAMITTRTILDGLLAQLDRMRGAPNPQAVQALALMREYGLVSGAQRDLFG